jgi:hypothetical protein
MIIFDLQCECRCIFEGWFDSRDDFDQQRENGLLSCPECASTNIEKVLSPVTHKSNHGHKNHTATADPEIEKQLNRFFRSVQKYVETNFEDVGPKFAEESLKIHYGVNEPKNIRGVTTPAEEKMLQDEGVDMLKIPVVKNPEGGDFN